MECYMKRHMSLDYLMAKYGAHFEANDSWENHLGGKILIIPAGCGGSGYDVRTLQEGPDRNQRLRVYDDMRGVSSGPLAVPHLAIPLANMPWLIEEGLEIVNYAKSYILKECLDNAEYAWGSSPVRSVLSLLTKLRDSGSIHQEDYLEYRKNYRLDYLHKPLPLTRKA